MTASNNTISPQTLVLKLTLASKQPAVLAAAAQQAVLAAQQAVLAAQQQGQRWPWIPSWQLLQPHWLWQ